MLWMRDHNLEGEVLRKLHVLTSFCVNVYFKHFFDIKVKHHHTYGPLHVVSSLKLLQKQTPEVKNIIQETMIRGAYHAHSENILTSLLCEDDPDDREFAVGIILRIREGRDTGDTSVRTHKTPKINIDASSVRALIDWNVDIHEPVFTCNMSIAELQKIAECPLKAPHYSVDTQSCERAVHEVAQSTQAVYGQEKRGGWVRARIDHRELLPVFRSKKNIVKAISM